MKTVLSIAGSDPSGGAGVQADLKTMCALGVYGMSVITALTVQNTRKVYAVQDARPDIVRGQMDAVFGDIRVDAVKIGMVADAANLRAIRDGLLRHRAVNIVLDPVMVSKSGCRLLPEEAEKEMKSLFPLAELVTPNILEAEALSGLGARDRDGMEKAAGIIRGLGARNVLVKGGMLSGDADDFLLVGDEAVWLDGPRVMTKSIQGTGCTLSSAIACGLARGKELRGAVKAAKEYVTRALRDSPGIGHGTGPLGHMAGLYADAGFRVG